MKVSSSDAVALWGMFEACDSAFAGIGALSLRSTLPSQNPRLWELRGVFFWAFQGAAGGAGVGPPEGLKPPAAPPAAPPAGPGLGDALPVRLPCAARRLSRVDRPAISRHYLFPRFGAV